ncbi:hypothetical protein AWC11_17250 [Mycobacterium interjectum]|nr:hypothetical protein AWC11_17250 [Mycobacterium interjectum]
MLVASHLSGRRSIVTDPNAIAGLRSMRVPEGMGSSQALKDFLIVQSQVDQSSTSLDEQINAHRQMLGLLIASHLEVVNILGAIEETLKVMSQRSA